MTAPASAQAHVQAVLDFAGLDREFAARLDAATRKAQRTVSRNLAGVSRAAHLTQADVNRQFDQIVLHLDTREWSRDMHLVRREAEQAGDGIREGLENQNYEHTGRSIASRVTSGFITGIRGIGAGFDIITNAGRMLILNAGGIATGFGIAAKIVRSFSAATFVSAVGLQAVASVGLTKLAGALKLIAAIASRVAREVGQVTAAFLVLQGVVRLVGGLTRFGRALAVITVGSAAAIGVISALGAAFAALATTVVAAAGAAAGAATGILAPAVAALSLGFGGLAEAKKAFETPGAGASQTNAVASAAKQLASAEKAVTRAKEDSLKAEEDLTRAREDQERQIRDVNNALRDNQLDERAAARAVRQARKDLAKTLADPTADADAREEAADRIKEAELDLLEIQERNREEVLEAQKVNAAGVENSDQVVAAKKRVADAADAVTEAEQQAAEAAQALAEAQSGGGAGGGPDPFYAMIGQRMAPLLDAFDNLKRAVTDDFSAALVPAFSGIGGLIERLTPKISGLAGLFGRIGSEASKSLTGPAGAAAFEQMTAASNTFFSALSAGENGLGGFTLGLAQFAATAAGTVAGGGGGLNTLLLELGEKLRNISAEQITATFDRFRQMAANVAAVFGPLIGLFTTLGGISAAALAPGFVAIGNAIREATPLLANMAQIIMPALGEVLVRLSPLIPALVQAFTPWAAALAAIAPPLASVVAHLAPLAPYLLAAATAAKVIGAAMVVWNAAMFAASVAQGVFAAATGLSSSALAGNTIALAAHRAALIAGSVAAHLFGAAMTVATGPIGLIILAVAAVAAALWAFFTKTETGKRWWEAIWNGIKVAVSATWEFLKVAWQWILDGLQWIGDKANWLWLNVLRPTFAFIGDAVGAVGSAVSWLWRSIFEPAFSAIGAVIGWWWNDFASPMLNNFRTLLGFVGAAVSAWWTGIVEPAFRGAGIVLGWLWDTIGRPVFENFKTGIGLVGEAFSWFKSHVVDPVFSGIGTAISTVWDNVGSPVFESLKTGVSAVGDAFSAAGRVIETAWTTVLDVLRPVAHAIGGALASVPQKIGPWEIPGADTANALGKKLQEFRTGGLALGPGTGTSDSMLAAISNGEYITRAAMVAKWLPLLEAINSGAAPSKVLSTLLGMLPGFAGGGLVSTDQLRNFARGIEGAAYAWGGWGNGWNTDCSGAGSALANYATQQLTAGAGQRSATAGMDRFLAGLGAMPGVGPAGSLSFGWFNGGPYGGHMGMTLPTGENVEMGGARGDGQFAGAAAGARDAMFNEHAHFPPEFFLGGDLGAGVGGMSPGTAALLGAGTGGSTGGTGGAGSPSTGGFTSPGTSSTPTAPRYGIAGANEWASQQDFAGQARSWGQDALKEIFGQFTEPFGLKPLSDMGVDRVAADMRTAAEALAAARAGGEQPLVGTVNVTGGNNPVDTANAVVAAIGERLTPALARYRNGG